MGVLWASLGDFSVFLPPFELPFDVLGRILGLLGTLVGIPGGIGQPCVANPVQRKQTFKENRPSESVVNSNDIMDSFVKWRKLHFESVEILWILPIFDASSIDMLYPKNTALPVPCLAGFWGPLFSIIFALIFRCVFLSRFGRFLEAYWESFSIKFRYMFRSKK